MWHGRYWRDVPGKETREHPLVVLGKRKGISKHEAEKKLADIIDKEGLNEPNFLERLAVPVKTFADAADAWESKRLPQLALSTQRDAPGQLALHLRPFFGALPVGTIKTGTVNDWIACLVKKGLEPTTIRNKWKMFQAIMNWNAQQADEPKRMWYPSLPDKPDVQARWYTVAEMMQIIDAAAEYKGKGIPKGQYRPLFQLTAFSGLRSGEISGLHVEDLDFVRGLVHVRRSVTDGIEVPTKGKRRRDVFIDSTTMRILKEYLGDRRTGRIFQGRDGQPVRNATLNYVLHWVADRVCINPGGMHAFRHGRVSHMRAEGVPLNIVQDQVGHQDKRTTDIYTHNEEAFIRETMERLAASSCTLKQGLYTN